MLLVCVVIIGCVVLRSRPGSTVPRGRFTLDASRAAHLHHPQDSSPVTQPDTESGLGDGPRRGSVRCPDSEGRVGGSLLQVKLPVQSTSTMTKEKSPVVQGYCWPENGVLGERGGLLLGSACHRTVLEASPV